MTITEKRAECKKNGLVYDVKTKKCRQRKKRKQVTKATSPKAKPVKPKIKKMTVAEKRAECKKNGLVYDVKTKKCRQRKKRQTVNKATAANPVKPVKLTLLGNCRKERLEYLKKGKPEYFTKQIETVSHSKVKSMIEQNKFIYRVVKKNVFCKFEKSYLKGKMPFYITEWGQLKSNEPSKIWNYIRKQKKDCGQLGPFSASWGTKLANIKGYLSAYGYSQPVYVLKLDLARILNKNYKIARAKKAIEWCRNGLSCLEYMHKNFDFILDRNDSELIMTEKFLKSRRNVELPFIVLDKTMKPISFEKSLCK
jgi:hypothetical protein